MRVLLTGATGFIGRRLLGRLPTGTAVLSRNPRKAEQSLAQFGVQAFAWDAENEPAPAAALEGVEVVFHLAGEPVSEGRWTKAKKHRLRESRVQGTRNLVQTLVQLRAKPRVLVSASAVGFYGDRGDEQLTETSASQPADFLSDICIHWEQEAHAATLAGIRVVNPRIGIVLGKGGALRKMSWLFNLGLGSALGSGQQFMPWVHLDDLVSQFLFAAERESLAGPFNATAPHPVTNREFTRILGRVMRRPTFMPPPPNFMLKAIVGEFANVLLQSQRAIPQKLTELGFDFHYPELEPALREVLT
jgi:uncharacterized protein